MKDYLSVSFEVDISGRTADPVWHRGIRSLLVLLLLSHAMTLHIV